MEPGGMHPPATHFSMARRPPRDRRQTTIPGKNVSCTDRRIFTRPEGDVSPSDGKRLSMKGK